MGSQPKSISASRGAAVLGLSKWASPIDVWLQICEEREPGFCAGRGYTLPEQPDNAAIRLGLLFEDNVIALAEQRQGYEIINQEQFWTGAPDHHFVTAHQDGEYLTPGPIKILHEGKTTSEFPFRAQWGEPGTDRVPQQYAVQAQHQMFCAGANECIISVLVFPKSQEDIEENISALDSEGRSQIANSLNMLGYFHQYPIARNDAAIGEMLKAYKEFWVHVENKTEPPITRWTDVARIFPAPKGTIIADERHERLLNERKDINAEIRNAKKRLDEIKLESVRWAREIGVQRGLDIDSDSVEKLIIVDAQGRKLASYNGKTFR